MSELREMSAAWAPRWPGGLPAFSCIAERKPELNRMHEFIPFLPCLVLNQVFACLFGCLQKVNAILMVLFLLRKFLEHMVVTAARQVLVCCVGVSPPVKYGWGY